MNIDLTKFGCRAAMIDDVKLIFDLSNDLIVRKNSIDQEPISWENHIEWYKKKLIDQNYFLFVFFLGIDFVGQVKFEVDGGEAIIGISIKEIFRGKGLAKLMIERGIKQFLDQRPSINYIVALIKPENIPSQRTFIDCQFQYDNEVIINNVTFYKYHRTTKTLE